MKYATFVGDELMHNELAPEVAEGLPSRALVNRYELALDVAISILQRIIHDRTGDSVRFGLTDSSPQGDYDWVWSMFIAIQKEKVVMTFRSICYIKNETERYVSELKASKPEGEEPTLAELCMVKEEWRPHLENIRKNIVLHVNPPTALAPGHRQLADHVAAEIYKAHLGSSPAAELDKEFDKYRGHCSDFGTEVGLPRFNLQAGTEALLPQWVDRAPLPPDIDGSDDDGVSLGADVDNGDGAGAEPQHQRPITAERSARRGEFMPRAYATGGVQHTSDNANVDANKSMVGWKPFFEELKQLEALLRSGERRRRYKWTCLRGTRWERFVRLFDNFTGSLYESRWHEVVYFLKQVTPLLRILCLSFNAARFLSGTDAAGEGTDQCSRSRARADTSQGMSQFDAAKFEHSIQGAQFHHFANMVLALDSLPTDFAQKLSLCPCHSSLTAEVDGFKARKIMEAHYGPGVRACPVAGKGIPEIVDEGVEAVLEKLKSIAESKILSFDPPSTSRPMSEEDWTTVFDSFRQGYRTSHAVLTLKFAYLLCLPMMGAGLAVSDQARARVNGQKFLDAVNQLPREQALHDPRTWELIKPGSAFLHGVTAFVINGCDFDDLNGDCQYEIAVFRFLWAIETTIEARHAKAALELRHHFCGPVRISLSNRLPMMEDFIANGVVTGTELLDAFNAARRLLDMAECFGFSRHPSLDLYEAGNKVTPADITLRPVTFLNR
jgi:hypothetical protein